MKTIPEIIQMSELSAKELKAALIITLHTLRTNTLEMNENIEILNEERNHIKNQTEILELEIKNQIEILELENTIKQTKFTASVQ